MSLSPGQKILIGCGIAALVAVGGFVLLIGGCVGMMVKGAVDFPAYAKAEVANPANKDVTDRINQLIVESTSLGQAQQKIAAEEWPAKVLYIGIKSGEGMSDFKDAYKRTNWTSQSEFQMNGNGYGSLRTPSGQKDIIILQRDQDTGNGVPLKYNLYIEHLKGS